MVLACSAFHSDRLVCHRPFLKTGFREEVPGHLWGCLVLGQSNHEQRLFDHYCSQDYIRMLHVIPKGM